MTPEQVKALRAVAELFIDTVKEAGEHGAPSGVMYAAVCSKLSLNQYEQIMAGLVCAGRLRKEGHVYHFVKAL